MEGVPAAPAGQPVVRVESLPLALLPAGPQLPVVEDVAGDEPEQVPLVHGLLLARLLPLHSGEVVVLAAGEEGGLMSAHGAGSWLTDCAPARIVKPKLVQSFVRLTIFFHLEFLEDKGRSLKPRVKK